MNTVKIRKNFLLDKDIIEKVQKIIKNEHTNLTEIISIYFKAIAKEPSLIKQVEDLSSRRTGSFIGMLDGKIGNKSYKKMKKDSLAKRDL